MILCALMCAYGYFNGGLSTYYEYVDALCKDSEDKNDVLLTLIYVTSQRGQLQYNGEIIDDREMVQCIEEVLNLPNITPFRGINFDSNTLHHAARSHDLVGVYLLSII